MKTKRILSALFALLTFVVTLSVGASAAWTPPDAVQSLSVKSTGWAYKEVSWAVTGDAAEFFAAVTAGEITYNWLVVNAKGVTVPVKAENGLEDLRDDAEGSLVLVMTPGQIKNYGTFTVTLNLNGVASQSVSVNLVDDTDLAAAIDAALAEAANPNGRYSDAYIAKLNAAIGVAMASQGMEGDTITAEAAAEAVSALWGIVAEKEYKLTGVGFLDDFLAPRIAGFWASFDSFTAPLRAINWGVVWKLIVKTITAMFTVNY